MLALFSRKLPKQASAHFYYSSMAKWIRPAGYSKTEINKAGKVLTGEIWSLDIAESLKIINNLRSSHGYPLHIVTKRMKKRAKAIDKDVFIAQRQKRLTSIQAKLKRFSKMELSRMQDLAGCRAVMSNVEQVKRLAKLTTDFYETTPDQFRLYDYLEKPKEDGYRGIHIVGRYRSLAEQNNVYDGMQIELQIRSRLQHAWATAVETVSTFRGEQLKSNIGNEDWKRFFALMGSAIALIEKCPLVPNTPKPSELAAEIRKLDKKLSVLTTLGGLRVVVKETATMPNARTFLLKLDTRQQEVIINAYTAQQSKLASKELLEREQEFANDDAVQVVLVSVDSLSTLRSAYPNYYLDTTEFMTIVQEVMGLQL
jgi:ppGpp synthetase/RelA/SpoT-type nucleotidyltranferase